jgi:CubicO group peptidase (beta-lactamase class C family)
MGVGRAGEGGTPVGPDTMFEAASLSKPVFAYLVMLLVQDGKLDLDRPLDAYLGAPYVPDDPRAASITARHVLSHTTGYRNWRFSADQRLSTDFAPGERFQYSGEGYYELQRVVETIAGKGLAAAARERVFAPLGMNRSSFIWKSDYQSQAAQGHRRDGSAIASQSRRTAEELAEQAESRGVSLEEWRHEDIVAALRTMSPPPPTHPVTLSPNAAGSLLTTVNDYLRFISVMLGVASGPLREDQRRGMLRQQIAIRAGLGWGLGWGLEEREGGTLFWHWGDNPGFKNFVMADPATGSAVLVFTNGDNGRPVYERVVRACGNFDPRAFLWI